jgi:hypothetical protein
MKLILFLVGVSWFVSGFVGAYITDIDTSIVIARFALALFMINTAEFGLLAKKIDKINKSVN